MIGPYSYHLYGVIFRYSQAKVPYTTVLELQPFRLRLYSNYAQLLLAGAAFLVVGWQKKVDLFKLSLLAITAIVAFRTMRDAWFQCVAAAACIADVAFQDSRSETRETPLQLGGVFAAVALLLLLGARSVDFNERGLFGAIRSRFPVNAVDFLRRNPPPGPLWNIFDWGGFLSWYMPQYPVAIDGRTDLYGDELDKLFYQTEMGDASYRHDPYLNQSGVVLLRTRDGLVPLLEKDSRFDKVYEDKIASVFVRPGENDCMIVSQCRILLITGDSLTIPNRTPAPITCAMGILQQLQFGVAPQVRLIGCKSRSQHIRRLPTIQR